MKNVLRVISVFLFVFLIMTFRSTVISAFDSGDGTSTNPYVIKTPGEMDDISDELDAYYVLGNDIYMTGYNLRPIGTYDAPFTGVLDGAGFLISNLSTRTILIDYSAGDFPNAYTMAMFGVVSGSAEIYNLGLNINYVFNDSDFGESGDIIVGGLVGLVDSNDVSIHDVWITGSIDVTVPSPYNFASIGGLIGEAYNLDIYGISFQGAITIDIGAFNGSNEEGMGAGGIIGYASNTILAYSTVFDSTFDITSNYEDDSVGGLVGYEYIDYLNDDVIRFCVVDNLKANSSGNNSVGGVVGYIYDGSGEHNYIYKNWVKNTTLIGGYYIGGIAGFAEDIEFRYNQVDFLTIGSETSLADGYSGGLVAYGSSLTLDFSRITDLVVLEDENSEPIGGLVGYVESSTIGYTYVSGTLNSLDANVGGIVGQAGNEVNINGAYFTGTLSGFTYVGGLVGYSYGSLDIRNSWTDGDFSAIESDAGGLVGYSDNNDLYIVDSYSLAMVSGPEFIGGLIGELNGANLYLARCYFGGTVSAEYSFDGLIGYESESYLNLDSLYSDEVNGNTEYGTAVPTADLKSATSDVGLDFEAYDFVTYIDGNTWFVSPLTNDGYLGVFADRDGIVFVDQETLIGIEYTWGEMLSMEEAVLFKMNLSWGLDVNPNIDYTINWGIKVVKPIDPKKTGFVFGGWYTDEEFTNPWDFKESAEEDIFLYAKWTAGIPDTGDIVGLTNGLLALGGILIVATKRRRI